jgi:hypothetical protein
MWSASRRSFGVDDESAEKRLVPASADRLDLPSPDGSTSSSES